MPEKSFTPVHCVTIERFEPVVDGIRKAIADVKCSGNSAGWLFLRGAVS